MMQPAQSRHGNDLCSYPRLVRRFSARWSLFVQSEMRPVVVVVARIFGQEAMQMAFVQDDHMIEQVAAPSPIVRDDKETVELIELLRSALSKP